MSDKTVAPPRPSASIIVISATNGVLLLQRVKATTSFASAYVFPGGNLSTFHEGFDLSSQSSDDYHQDSLEYRLAAIRETFEESGLLLVHGSLPSAKELERGRELVHANQIPFPRWLQQKGLRADVEGLLPFTRWISPTYAKRRFTTQMYVYLLPMRPVRRSPMSSALGPFGEQSDQKSEADVRTSMVPTADGGLEHTDAKFLAASAWCKLAQEGRIVLYPPQFFLLHHVAQLLDGGTAYPAEAYESGPSIIPDSEELSARRKRLVDFIRSNEGGDDAPWSDKCISPMRLREGKRTKDGREIMALHDPGYELKNSKKSGVMGSCMLFDLQKEGTRGLSVISRESAMSLEVKL